MKVHDVRATNARLAEAIEHPYAGWADEARRVGGGAWLKLNAGPAEDWTFRRGTDGVWRWTWQSTYGNGSHVWGAGCDASGFVPTPDVAAMLETRWAAAVPATEQNRSAR